MKIKNIMVITICMCLSYAEKRTNINEIGRQIIEEIWAFHPVDATYRGLHQYDSLLGDYTKSNLKHEFRLFKKYQAQLDKVDTLTLHTDELIDYKTLAILLNIEIFQIDIAKYYDWNPLFYVNECIGGIYYLMIRYAPSNAIRMNAINKRLKLIPQFLANAKKNLKAPPALFCSAGIEQLSEGKNLIEEVFRVYKDSVDPGLRLDFERSKNTAMIAIEEFKKWLELHSNSITPFALGRDKYEFKMENVHLLDFSADSLQQLGENTLGLANRLIDSLIAIHQVLPGKKGFVPPDFGKADIAEYRKKEILDIRNFVNERKIVTVPEWVGEFQVVETPAFLRGIIPGIAMEPPGAFDASRTGYFYIQPIAGDFDSSTAQAWYNYVINRKFRGSVVHEGFPGHFLQLSIANNHLSLFRQNLSDNFMVEGWALYCEEMMSNSGLYEDTLGAYIGALRGVKFRAARVIVDVKLQTGQFTYNDAVNFMCKTFDAGKEDSVFFSREVLRYATDPCQPSSYLVGKFQIMDLRERYKQKMGNTYSLNDFHDHLLNQGSIPVKLIERCLLQQ